MKKREKKKRKKKDNKSTSYLCPVPPPPVDNHQIKISVRARLNKKNNPTSKKKHAAVWLVRRLVSDGRDNRVWHWLAQGCRAASHARAASLWVCDGSLAGVIIGRIAAVAGPASIVRFSCVCRAAVRP